MSKEFIPKIILISGKMQSGKTTSAQYLMSKLKNSKEFLFADPLKHFLIEVFGLQTNQCYGSNDQKNSPTNVLWQNLPFGKDINELMCYKYTKGIDVENPMTARQLMQIFGTEICRGMYNDCWAKAALSRIISSAFPTEFAFITDARFPNELEVFKPYNPVVVRLTRNNYSSNHDSENMLNDYDFSQFKRFVEINNEDLTMEQRNQQLDNLVIPLIME